MTEQKPRHLHAFITWAFFATILMAVSFSFYKYYYGRDFDYYVEASCDTAKETCFFRDCEGDPDQCPPNQLSYYKMYYLKAYDFPSCVAGDCGAACDSGRIACEKIECSPEAGDECVIQEEFTTIQNDSITTGENTEEAQ